MPYHPSDDWPLVGDVRRWLRARRQRMAVEQWRRNGCPAPPPHSVKHGVVLDYATRFRCHELVETGTFMGDMVEATRRDFDRVYSIELGDQLFERAKRRFAGCDNVEILHGDSGEELPKLLPRLTGPTLFWLDGHWSAGATARGEMDTPISAELGAVLPLLDQGHVVLIDDARQFGSEKDYPSLEEVETSLAESPIPVDFAVELDIIRITAAGKQRAAA